MRRPINWLVFALSVGFFLWGRGLQAPTPAPVAVERPVLVPELAAAVPAALRRHEDLEFGYVSAESL